MLYYPLPISKVSEWPGPRDGGSWWHYGTDFAVPVGTPLMAAFDGVVVFAGGDGASGWINGVKANGEGLTVDIQRADGLIARYGHLSSYTVRVGDRVKAGQIICKSGNTGYTTGPHCHWELRWDRAWSAGAWADPRKLGAVEFKKQSRTKEIKVKHSPYTYRKARPIKPEERLYLVNSAGKKQNCAGGTGPNALAAHVYGDGFAEGDILELRYEWYTKKTKKPSAHYSDRVIADRAGMIRATRTFLRPVDAGVEVHLSVYASSTNKKVGTISLLDSDAYLFTAV